MKITSSQLALWQKKHNIAKLKFIVVYGPDESGVDLTVAELVKHLASGAQHTVTKIDYKVVKDDFTMLADSLNSVSLFGDMTIIVVEDCPATLPKALLEFLMNKPFAGKLILQAGDLKPASNLRKMAEGYDNALSIACYKEDMKQIALYIRESLQAAEVKFDDAVVVTLARILPSNKMLIEQELRKLLLYTLGRSIRIEDISKVVCDAQEVVLDELCVAMLRMETAKALRLLENARKADTSFMLILRVLQRYVNRILEVLSYIEQGMTCETAIAKLTPPVFFKQRDSLIQICKTAAAQKILALSADLMKLELNCKRMPLDEYILMGQFIMRAQV